MNFTVVQVCINGRLVTPEVLHAPRNHPPSALGRWKTRWLVDVWMKIGDARVKQVIKESKVSLKISEIIIVLVYYTDRAISPYLGVETFRLNIKLLSYGNKINYIN